MRTCFNLVGCFALIAVLASAGILSADEPPQLERLPLKAGDISSVTGLNIYKFRVAMKPSTEFKIAVSVHDSANAKPRVLSRHLFTSNEDVDTVDLLLSFLPLDNTLRGVLLSQDEEVSYRIDCPRCFPSGMGTIISLPLSDIRGTRKTLIPMTAERSTELSDENEICLIAILTSEDGKPASTQKSYPRAKISLTFAD